VVLESRETSRDDAGFDTDVALFTGELAQLIPDLVRALGGELQRDKPALPAAAPAPASPEAALEAPWV
jgi:recombination associated protein RdgC